MITNLTTVGAGLGRPLPSAELAWGLGTPFELGVVIEVETGIYWPEKPFIEKGIATGREKGFTVVHAKGIQGRAVKAKGIRPPSPITQRHKRRLTTKHPSGLVERHKKPLN